MNLIEDFVDKVFAGKEPKHREQGLRLIMLQGGVHTLSDFLSQHQTQQWTQSLQLPLLPLVLLYMLTASILIKLFLIKEDKIQRASFFTQIIGIILIFLDLLYNHKKKNREREEPEFAEAEPQTKIWKVRRGRQILCIQFSKVQRGDLLLLSHNDEVPADGIVMKVENPLVGFEQERDRHIVVVESRGATQAVEVSKHALEECVLGNWLDPFLFKGSKIASGSAWMLLCRIEQNSQQKDTLQQIGCVQPMVNHRLVYFLKWSIVIPFAIVLLKWLSNGCIYKGLIIVIETAFSLVFYLRLLEQDSALQFIKQQTQLLLQHKLFSVDDMDTLNKIQKGELLVLEDKFSDSLQSLSLLNLSHNVKIVSERKEGDIQNQFAQMLSPVSIYSEDRSYSLRIKLQKLEAAKFVLASPKVFQDKYLSLLTGMDFEVVMLSQEEKPQLISYKGSQRQIWARVKTNGKMSEILLDLQLASLRMRKLCSSFGSILANQCIEIALLVGVACFDLSININLGILMLYFTRASSLQLLIDWRQSERGWGFRQGKTAQLTLITILYNMLMLRQLVNCSDKNLFLFILVLSNRLFRFEALKQLFNYKSVLNKTLFLIAVSMVGMLLEFQSNKDWAACKVHLAIFGLPLLSWVCHKFVLSIQ